MHDFYILNEAGEPVATDDLIEWGKWHITANRTLASDYIPVDERYQLFISTVFLGMDHGYPYNDPNRKPVLWETMVFYQPKRPRKQKWGSNDMDWEDLYQERYTSKEDAVENHQHVVAYLKEKLEQSPDHFPEVIEKWLDEYRIS